MILTHKITLPLDRRDETQIVSVVQGDSARALEFSLLNNGAAWTIPEGVTAMLCYRRADGRTGGAYDTLPDGSVAYSVSENKLTVQLLPQLLAAAGATELQVTLLKDGASLTCFSVLLHVQGNLWNTAEDEECYVNLKGQIREEVDAAMGDFTPSGDSAGIHIGPEAPEEDVVLWVDTDEESSAAPAPTTEMKYWTCLAALETTEEIWTMTVEPDAAALSGCTELRFHLRLPATEYTSSLVTKLYDESGVVLSNTMTSVISNTAETCIYQQLSNDGTVIRGNISNEWEFMTLKAKKYDPVEPGSLRSIVFDSPSSMFRVGSRFEIWGR